MSYSSSISCKLFSVFWITVPPFALNCSSYHKRYGWHAIIIVANVQHNLSTGKCSSFSSSLPTGLMKTKHIIFPPRIFPFLLKHFIHLDQWNSQFASYWRSKQLMQIIKVLEGLFYYWVGRLEAGQLRQQCCSWCLDWLISFNSKCLANGRSSILTVTTTYTLQRNLQKQTITQNDYNN